MGYYYFQCRSVTYAQRASKFLKGHNIYVGIAKLPMKLSDEGCGYCIRIAERNGLKAYKLLKTAGYEINRIYFSNSLNEFSEVQM